MQRFCLWSKMWDKSAVVRDKTRERSQILKSSWLRPVFLHLCLVRISFKTISRYHVSQEVNFWTEKLTLLRLELKTMMSTKCTIKICSALSLKTVCVSFWKRPLANARPNGIPLYSNKPNGVAISWVDFYLVVRRGHIHG